jgi:predicted DNA binding protein
MSVIVELRVDGDDFELGRILQPPADGRLEFEWTVPVEDGTLSFWVHGYSGDATPDPVQYRSSVEELRSADSFDGMHLYALQWTSEEDDLMAAISEADGHLLEGRATDDVWKMELRFPGHENLSSFQTWCDEHGVDMDIERLYDHERPPEPRYGLTERQYETLALAVESGYYDIPRRTTTKELAERLAISDQAVTERLRRAITSLVERTVLSRDE